MKLAVGYQLSEAGEESFVDLLTPWREHLAEVYFAWPGHASGRSPIGTVGGALDPEAFQRFERDLARLRGMGLRLDLLFNANCYGGDAMSVALEREVVSVLTRLSETVGGAEVVTTTSPAIAWIVKRRFPSIETRASVNLRIGTVEGMRYLAHVFDSYHVQRDFNRDLDRLRELRTWADANGKRLFLLANSGCLRNCSGQTFHDNLVAHETEVSGNENLSGFMPYACWNYLRDRANWPALLQSTWIRPEDLHHYGDLFPVVKLATRLHERPQAVVRAYAQRRWSGNLLDLLEPGHSPALAPYVIDNTRFPPDWFERTSRCDRQCQRCDYCVEVLAQTLVRVG
jgi:collagenase-like PrtC family protease